MLTAHEQLQREYPWLPGALVNPGWLVPVRRLCLALEAALGRDVLERGAAHRRAGGLRLTGTPPDPEDPWCCVTRVSRKWGSLDVQAIPHPPEIDAAVDECVLACERTCEICGREGRMRDDGWSLTRCDACDEEASQ